MGWQEALARKGPKVNAFKKTEVNFCICGGRIVAIYRMRRKLDWNKLINYNARSIVSQKGGCKEDALHRVGGEWGNWGEMIGTVCGKVTV